MSRRATTATIRDMIDDSSSSGDPNPYCDLIEMEAEQDDTPSLSLPLNVQMAAETDSDRVEGLGFSFSLLGKLEDVLRAIAKKETTVQ